jgi:hypothetical protein
MEKTWEGVLAGAVALAKAAVALPSEGEGGRWKAAVPSVIALHAIIEALKQTPILSDAELRVAQDRSAVMIREHAGAIHDLWRGVELPGSLRELVEEARAALEATRTGGLEWVVSVDRLVAPHPGELGLALVAGGFEGECFVPAAGVPLFCGCPAAFVAGVGGGRVSAAVIEAVEAFLASAEHEGRQGSGVVGPRRCRVMRQAYRQFDFARGKAVRDIVLPMDAELQGGQPLLVPLVVGGQVQPVPMPIRGQGAQEALPVVEAGEERRQGA